LGVALPPVFGVFGDGKYKLQPIYVDSPPTGSMKLTDWAKKHSETLGFKYTSELARRVDRESEYKSN